MDKLLLTHEIGSLAKPSWRVKAINGKKLNEEDLAQAVQWGEELDISEVRHLVTLLNKRENFTKEEKQEIIAFSSLYAIKLLEKAGLDLIWDGEQQRVEMYEYPISCMTGFKFYGHVRSFDNKYFRKASCTDVPKLLRPFHVKEYERIKKITNKTIKIPITGPYTLMDWSYDEYYLQNLIPGEGDIIKKRERARRLFLKDLAQNILYPNLKALIEVGVSHIQIDEPAATTKSFEVNAFVEGIKASIGNLAGKAFFSLHICFSDYEQLFPAINHLEGYVSEIHFEYANRDHQELGINKRNRKAFKILQKFKDNQFKIGLGVIDVHSDFIESPQLVCDRILYAMDTIKDPYRFFISPDCGLRTRSWPIAYQKLSNMVLGRHLALKKLGLDH